MAITVATGIPDGYRLERRPPTVRELRALNHVVGWQGLPDSDDAVYRGLAASLFGVVVLLDGETIACARLIGDGGIYYYLQDLIVHPDHQGRRIGDLLMGEVWRYLGEHADRSAFIGLMTAEGMAGFYERWGFAQRPPGRPGMALGWDPEDPPPTPGSASPASA